MLIYILSFITSSIFCLLAERKFDHNKLLSNIYFIVAVIIVSIIAGLRDYTVGTDISTYGNYLFNAANKNSHLIDYIKLYPDIDLLYLVLNFIITRFFDNAHWLYFVIGILIYGFTLKGIIFYRRKISVSIGWLCFLFIFYGDTLNAMRQFIALAIVFWGFHFVLEKKYKKYIISVIIATLFHNTAIISIGIFLIYFILHKKNTLFVRIGMIFGSSVFILLYSQILNFFIKTGILNDRFTRYLDGGGGFQLNPFIIRLPFLIVILLYYSRFCKFETSKTDKLGDDADCVFIIIMLFIEIITAQMRAILPALYRISFYFGFYKIVGYSRIQHIMKGNEKVIMGAILIMYLSILWIYQNVLQGNNDIYPYTSEILRLQ